MYETCEARRWQGDARARRAAEHAVASTIVMHAGSVVVRRCEDIIDVEVEERAESERK